MGIITRLCISGYRSLRDIRLELGAFTVVTGANGSGKSSLYRALRLLADIAQGRIIQSLALEGGFPSALWAGPETFSRSVRQGIHPVQGAVRKGPNILARPNFVAHFVYEKQNLCCTSLLPGLTARRPAKSQSEVEKEDDIDVIA